MTTYLLIPGGGCDPFCWRFVIDALAERGHRGIAVDLPCEDDSADLNAYADAVVDQNPGDDGPPVVVAHSFGGFTGALASPRVGASALIYVSAMIPQPGERLDDWWGATDCAAAQRTAAQLGGYDLDELYYNGVDPAIVAEEVERGQSGTPSSQPWPGAELPRIATRFVLFGDDRFFPEPFMRRIVDERLGIRPKRIPGGHMAMLSHPAELADVLVQT